jgi:hypothetical protein
MRIVNDQGLKNHLNSCSWLFSLLRFASSQPHGVLLALCFFVAALNCAAQSNITYQYDNARTGQNTSETILTPSNVNVNQFGKLFSLPVTGQIYAQPLYVPSVAISGKGTHNVIIVATENDSVYAFDADSNTGANASPLWQVSLVDATHGATSGETALNSSTTIGCTDLQPLIGITSTPVIDTGSGTIYLEAKSVSGSNYFHRLHALDIATGSEKSPGPIQIKATVSGTGDGNSNNQLVFDSNNLALHHLNRPGLLLMNGTIFLSYASHCDFFPYHGWLFAYDAATFAQKGVFVTTPNGGLGGFWMSGAGLAGDANGNIYAATGNGSFSQGGPLELGDSILKFNFSNGTLSLADYFTPFNQNTLNGGDTDLGSGGVLLLPDQPGSHPHVLVQAGKEGRIYLVDRDKLTTNPANTSQEEPFCSSCTTNDPQIVQESGSGLIGGMWSMPAYWNNATYWWGSGDVLKSIPLSNGLLDFTHITSSTGSYGFPGASPSISANGTSNGIVWSVDSSQYGSPGPGPGPAVLHAHDATNVARELWNSTQAANSRDQAGNAVKFSVPRIANGRVYIGTSTEVDVYGLLNAGTPTTATPVISPGSESVTSSVPVTITDSTSGAAIYYTTDGSNPSAASPTHGTRYTGGFTVTSTTTVKAAAIASGAAQSGIATATYTIQPNAVSSIDYSSGMSAIGLTLSGSASIINSRLRLTDTGASEAGSAFVTNPLNVQSFSTDFLFQLTSPNADGFTFAIHGGSTPSALGVSGGGLGYGPDTPTGTPGIPNSVAVKFDLYNNAGEGTDSTGLYTNGVSPTTPFVDMTGSGINLHSGDIFQVHMSYDGTNLAMTITDTSTQNTFSHTWQVNIPSTVGGSTGYVGFTGGTGGLTAIQEIIDWTYVSGPTTTPQAATPAINPTPTVTYTSSVTVTLTDSTTNATITYTTDGSAPVPGSHGTAVSSGGSFPLTSSATIRAIASASGFTNSQIASASYTVLLLAPTPQINPAPGTYTNSVTVSITDSATNAAITYTIDGSAPVPGSHGTPIASGGSFTLTSSATVKAVASASGFANSAVASAAYAIQSPLPPAATPAISPNPGTYPSPLTVKITDITTNATITYTTDGTTPVPSSHGTAISSGGSFSLTSPATVQAVASASGFSNSTVASAAYTVQASASSINFASGFTGETALTLNGGATINGTRLRLTDGGGTEARSAFFNTQITVQSFTNDFRFQLTNPSADGFTFTIQGNAANSVGPSGGGLGYGPDTPTGTPGIPKSVAVKFDLYSNAGEGIDSTGWYTNGVSPTTPALDMATSGVNLHSGDIMNVHMTYDGTTLTWTVTDPTAGKSFTTSAAVNIPSFVGGNSAFVGFTAGTGGATATQEIISWTYTPGTPTGTKNPIQYEAESSAVFNASSSSGPTYRVFAWSGFTDGSGTTLDATKAGDNVTITLNIPTAGVYDVKVATKRHSTRGIVQLSVNGTNVGPAEDEYSAADVWQEFDLGTVSLAAGNQPFKFTTTGKSAASGGFTQAFDYIKLTPQ